MIDLDCWRCLFYFICVYCCVAILLCHITGRSRKTRSWCELSHGRSDCCDIVCLKRQRSTLGLLQTSGFFFRLPPPISPSPNDVELTTESSCDPVQTTFVFRRFRALAGPWKSWNNFSRFSRPGKSLKTDAVLESPWICVWRSLKVLEFDFLKRGQEARESYFSSYQKRSVA